MTALERRCVLHTPGAARDVQWTVQADTYLERQGRQGGSNISASCLCIAEYLFRLPVRHEVCLNS